MLAPYKFPDLTPLADVKPRELTPELDQVGRNLMNAAALIRKYGLLKFDQGSMNEGFCVHGAISMALYGEVYRDGNAGVCPTVTAIRDYVSSHGFPGFRNAIGIAEWNNAPERTADEVIAALESAALTRALHTKAAE